MNRHIDAREIRVAHVIKGRCNPAGTNGVDVAVAGMASVQARGAAVSVFSLTEKEPAEIVGVDSRAVRPEGVLKSSVALANEIAEWKPDIVHIHSIWIPEFTLLGAILHRRGTPFVISPHGALSPRSLVRGRWKKRLYALVAERRGLRRAAGLHAVTSREAREMRMWDRHLEPFVVANGVFLGPAVCPHEIESMRSEMAIPAGATVCTFLGRKDVECKGIDLLLQAAAGLRAERPGNIVVVAGPASNDQSLVVDNLVQTLGLDSVVRIYPALRGSRKRALLALSDVVVVPSRWDASPLVLLEAMAAGCPVVTTTGVGLSEDLTGCAAVRVVEPTTDALCSGIRGLLAEGSSRLELRSRARMFAEEHFDAERGWLVMLQEYARFIGRERTVAHG